MNSPSVEADGRAPDPKKARDQQDPEKRQGDGSREKIGAEGEACEGIDDPKLDAMLPADATTPASPSRKAATSQTGVELPAAWPPVPLGTPSGADCRPVMVCTARSRF